MRVPNAVHEAHPWVIGKIAPDFDLLDVWALPIVGDAEGFDEFLEFALSLDPAGAGVATRALFAARTVIGAVLGWDRERDRPIPGVAETMLRDRLPPELRATSDDPALRDALRRGGDHGFVPLYRTPVEAAAEISNATVHGVLHLAWVPRGDGRYRPHLAVYVKRRGALGAAYLKLIEPFRHFIVYPAMTRRIGRAWAARDAYPKAPDR